MPTESRQIAFREAEFFNAVRDYRLRRGEPLPMGSVLGIDIREEPDLTATIRISNDEGDSIETVALPTESIAAALILFCINRKIPLTANAAKSIRTSGDNIILLIDISADSFRAPKSASKTPGWPYIKGDASANGTI